MYAEKEKIAWGSRIQKQQASEIIIQVFENAELTET